MPANFDALIIGMGKAGPSLAARLSGADMKVAVLERHKFGGTYINDGCNADQANGGERVRCGWWCWFVGMRGFSIQAIKDWARAAVCAVVAAPGGSPTR
jgi:choline dehydrogenase-like flavoprotein